MKSENSKNGPRLGGMFNKFLSEDQIRIVQIMLKNGLTKAQIFEYFSRKRGVGKPHCSEIHTLKDENKVKRSW